MSVKIYEGLRAAKDTDPFTLAQEIRSVTEHLFYEKIAAYSYEIQHLFEERDLSDDDRLDKVLSRMQSLRWLDERDVERIEGRFSREVLSREREHEMIWGCVQYFHEHPVRTFSPLDFGYEVHLLPSTLPTRPLALVYSESKDYLSALLDKGVVEEYGYWDNSDRAEDISEEEWSQRRKDWGILIDSHSSTSSQSLHLNHPSRLDVACSRIVSDKLAK